MNDTALLVIDVQRGLFNRSAPVCKAKDVLANINALEDRARAQGAPVVYVQHCNDSLLVEGTENWMLRPEMRPQDGDPRILKHHGSAFEKTPLGDELRRRGVSRIVACGMVTHGCVKAACLDGVKLGYRVVLAADAHSNYSKKAAQVIDEWHEKLRAAGVELKPAAEIDFKE